MLNMVARCPLHRPLHRRLIALLTMKSKSKSKSKSPAMEKCAAAAAKQLKIVFFLLLLLLFCCSLAANTCRVWAGRAGRCVEGVCGGMVKCRQCVQPVVAATGGGSRATVSSYHRGAHTFALPHKHITDSPWRS